MLFFFPFDFNRCQVWSSDNHCHVNGKLLSIFVLISCSRKIQDQNHWRMKSFALLLHRAENAWVTAARSSPRALLIHPNCGMEEWMDTSFTTAFPLMKGSTKPCKNHGVFCAVPTRIGNKAYLLLPVMPRCRQSFLLQVHVFREILAISILAVSYLALPPIFLHPATLLALPIFSDLM